MPISLTLLTMLLFCGALCAAAIVVILAVSLLRPPRMTDGKALWVLRRVSPADVGLASEDVHFDVRDEQTGKALRIAAWWIPDANAQGRVVLMLHGYADAKIGAIAWAPLWHRLGFNILAIDLRAHGQSGGVYSTGGFWERHDVGQVIEQLRAQRPADSKQVVLFGVSLGAGVAAAVAAIRGDIAALVLDSTFADFTRTAMAHMDRLGSPGRALQGPALALSQRIAAADFSATRLLNLLPQISAPTFAILPSADAMLGKGDHRQIVSLMENRKATSHSKDSTWIVDDSPHLGALLTQPEEYEQRLRGFLDASLLGKR